MPNFTPNVRDTSPTPYSSSNNGITFNGLIRINTGIVDQDGTGDPIRTAMHKILSNFDKTLTIEDAASAATASKVVIRDSNADVWARMFHGDLVGSAETFSGTLDGDITGTMTATQIKNTTAAGQYTLLTVNNRGLVTTASKPTSIVDLGITDVVRTNFQIVTANPLTGGGALNGGSITLGLDPSFLGTLTIPSTAHMIPGDGIQLAPQDGGGTYRLIDNLTITVRLTESSHGVLGSYVGGLTNQPMHALATTTTPGFMSPTDKAKIDGLGDGFTRGMIIMWHRPKAQIPGGWAHCNGQNGTPNLVKRFPRGAEIDGELGQYIGSATHAHAVDTPGTVLTVAQLPAHQFTGTTVADGSHYHTGNTGASGTHRHSYSVRYSWRGPEDSVLNRIDGRTNGQESNFWNDFTSTDGSHIHNFVSDWAGAHAHGFVSDWLGSNQPHTHPRVTSFEASNMPEATYTYFIMKL